MSNYENVATRNKKARQEALRDYLEQRGKVDYVFDLLEKIEDESNPLDNDMLPRYKIAIDTRLKILAKYLPDLKQTELIGDPENPLHVRASELSDEQLAAIIANSSRN